MALLAALSSAESQVAAEGPAGVLALERLLVAQRAAFKGLLYSTAPIHIACAAAGRNDLPKSFGKHGVCPDLNNTLA